jgi:hypothetical protein
MAEQPPKLLNYHALRRVEAQLSTEQTIDYLFKDYLQTSEQHRQRLAQLQRLLGAAAASAPSITGILQSQWWCRSQYQWSVPR